MAELLRLAKGDATPVAPTSFILTETARDIMRSLKMIETLSGPRMTAICGASGIGKTCCLMNYLESDPYVWLLTVAAGEGSEKSLAESLCHLFGVSDARSMSLSDRRLAVMRTLTGVTTLILDESQHLSTDAIHWVRILCAQAGCNLALAGAMILNNRIMSDDQLNSRTILKRVFGKVGGSDVAAIARAYGVDHGGIASALEGVAHLGGGLRNVTSVLEIARAMAGDSAVGHGDIIAAIGQLGLGQGGK